MINLLATHITPAAQFAAWAAAHPLLPALLVTAMLVPVWAVICLELGDLIGKVWYRLDIYKAAKRAQRAKKGPLMESQT